MALTVDSLREAVTRILANVQIEHEHLTSLDGQIGDGDLGITLLKAFRELDRIKGEFSDDVGQALMQGAQAVSRVSSSSFGTLLATSMMAAAKQTKGHTEVEWSAVPEFLNRAVEAMMARGKASLGDKTVMDAVSGAAKAAAGKDTPEALLPALLDGTKEAIGSLRDKPNKIGRARIFAERTIGMDDPGMVAFKVMLEAL
jgi:phosphoenolpyruvate---glycerone phosphotransferase subunit DhaL